MRLPCWYDSRFELVSERERRKSSLRKALKEQPRIKQLARNPLLLTIIALIHRYQARLPKERYKLYDKAVETLLTTWDSHKELSNHEILEYLELDDLRRLMERLAYWIHCQGGTGDTEGGTLIDRDELIIQLTQYIREMKDIERHQAKAEAKRFLEQIVRDRAGLLSLQGQDRYAFVHKTFQEYLTAMEIRDCQEEGFEVVLEHIEDHLHDSHWEEVLLLLIAQQKRNNPVKILRAILEHDAPYEQLLHRNLFFAGKVLGENVPVTDTNLVDTILNSLMKLEISQLPLISDQLRHQISRIYYGLYETAFEHAAIVQVETHKNHLDQWRFLEYQVELSPENAEIALLGLLKDEISEVRLQAASILIRQKRHLDKVTSTLLELSEHTQFEFRDRSRAFHLLQELGKIPEIFIRDVIGKLNGVDPDLYVHVLNVLMRVNKSEDFIANALIELLSNEEPGVRARAAAVLGLANMSSDNVIEALINLLEDSEAEVRARAAEALGRMEQVSDTATEALVNLLKDSEAEVRAHAAEVLGQMEQASDAVVETLIDSLKDRRDSECYRSPKLLVKLCKNSSRLIEMLVSRLESKSLPITVRRGLIYTLGEAGITSETLIKALINQLRYGDSDIRFDTVEALGKLQPLSDEVLDSLIDLLKDDNSDTSFLAAHTLVKAGNRSDSVINILLNALKDDTLEAGIRSNFGRSWTNRRFMAESALVSLGKDSRNVELYCSQWIERHKNDSFVGNGIDLLWKLVS